MDLLSELENMACNIVDDVETEPQIEQSDVTRWEHLFGNTPAEAIFRIEQHRNDFTRRRVSEDHWKIASHTKKAEGYDREAYEHEIESGGTKRIVKAGHSVSQASSKSTYILKLEGPLNTAAKVQEVANLDVTPSITAGIGESGEASFVTIDTIARDMITLWLSKQRTSFAPTLVRISKSGKDLSASSLYPTLGVDTTLPQYRSDTVDVEFLPAQSQYPVWYFFYGNLAVPEILSRRLALLEEPVFTPATVSGGVIKKWRGKYNALLDSDDPLPVEGWAYLVEREEHEEALRLYETENYDIVRCTISIEGRSVVKGLTFRFVGPSEELG